MNIPIRPLAALLGAHLAAASLAAAPPDAPPDAPVPIAVSPSKGSLDEIGRDSGKVRVTFPTPMVDLDKVKRPGQPSPVLFDPVVPLTWTWVSPTEGALQPAAKMKIAYRAKLRAGLKDLAGKAVDAKNWGMVFEDDKFALKRLEFLNVFGDASGDSQDAPPPENPAIVKGAKPAHDAVVHPIATGPAADDDAEIQERNLKAPLVARPKVRLEFSRDVLPQEVAQVVHYKDSKTQQLFPVQVTLEERQTAGPQGWMTIEPRTPLPPNHALLLVIDPLQAPASGEKLPHLVVAPAGTTFPLTVRRVSGYNQPLKGAFIRVVTNHTVEPDAENLSRIQVQPAVPKMKIVPGEYALDLEGEFDTKTEYRVTLKAGLKSTAYDLEKDANWKVHFPAKRPAIALDRDVLADRASAPASHCSFIQVNTQALHWNIAKVPRAKLAAVAARLREFGAPIKDKDEHFSYDAKTGEYAYPATELLVPKLALPVVASGEVEASGGDREVRRELEWRPGTTEAGIYLLEISGRDARGRAIGNRALISRTDWVISRIQTLAGTTVRVASMNDGRPVAGVPVEMLAAHAHVAGPKATNADGEAIFAKAELGNSADEALAGAPGRECLQPLETPNFRSGHREFDEPEKPDDQTLAVVVTDRNVYRPGETLKFKAFLREWKDGALFAPAAQPVEWSIARSGSDGPPAFEATTLPTPAGSFEGTWEIPKTAFGDYLIRVAGHSTKITVAEFRPPPFSVAVNAEDASGDTARAQVTSMHFHGAPNAGAKVRWKAEWIADNWQGEVRDEDFSRMDFAFDDLYSPDSPTRGLEVVAKAGWDTTREDTDVSISATAQGETTLDASGTAALVCRSPFPPESAYGRARVFWVVDVTGPAAQTQRGGASARVQFVPQILAAAVQSDGTDVILDVHSFDAHDEPAAGLAAKAELFRAGVKTVKEALGTGVLRYRNSPTFEKVWEGEVVTPFHGPIKAGAPGEYVVRVTAPKQPHTPAVSTVALVDGPGEAEVAVDNDEALNCKPDRQRYTVGDTATIALQSPFSGVATVTVETDRVLFRKVVELDGNAQRIAIPVQPSFAPNAFVAVHLVKRAPGGAVPAERFGSCEIQVENPDQRLHVATTLASPALEPGAGASGVVQVTMAGRPAAGADVMIFAVDEAVLALGRWKLPDFTNTFFPPRKWEIVTHTALGSRWTPAEPRSLSHAQKGFILGDVGGAFGTVAFRKDFKVLAYWNASARADAKGEVPFQFKAPDALTSYRIVAVAQRGADQFGTAETKLTLAKKLQIESVLPDFLRQADEISLRATVTQNYADSDQATVTVATDAALQLTEAASKSVTLSRGVAAVIAFRAKVVGDPKSARIGFIAKSAGGASDAEEHTLPVHPPTIERRAATFGEIKTGVPLDVTAAVPPAWLTAAGKCDVLLSGSAYLPKLAGFPEMLDGTGSIEKIATRVLAATVLADTLDSLPLAAKGDAALGAKVSDGLKRFAQAALEGGGVPLWPGGQCNHYATIEAAWAILNARKRQFDTGSELPARAEGWLDGIIHRQQGFEDVAPDLRCFALMVRGATRVGPQPPPADFQADAEELFQDRQTLQLSDEGRAWLALGLHYFGLLPADKKALLVELARPGPAPDFDPLTFSSATRVEALRLLAQTEIGATNLSASERDRVRKSFATLAQSAAVPSTQESLWLLVLFNAVTRGEIPPAMAARTLVPPPRAKSKNGFSVGWLDVPLGSLPQTFASPLKPGVKGSYLIRATYRAAENDTPTNEPALNIEREVRNLSAGARVGSAQAPFQLGDEVLVTYRMNANQSHSYLELEDQLPACFETVNPKLPLIAENFHLPIEAGVNTLPLSHVELRFARTLLYFDRAAPGRNVYSVIARVTAAGAFHWPGTQVRPLYDSRYSGTSGSLLVYAQ